MSQVNQELLRRLADTKGVIKGTTLITYIIAGDFDI